MARSEKRGRVISAAQGVLMVEDRFIRFELPDEAGNKVAIKLFTPHLRQFLTEMLAHIATCPVPPPLTGDVPADDSPISPSFFGISPIEGTDLARLTIGVGPIDLQLALPLSD